MTEEDSTGDEEKSILDQIAEEVGDVELTEDELDDESKAEDGEQFGYE